MQLEEQLELICSWFHGSFDNHYQYHLEKEQTSAEPVHDWVYSKFFKANVSKFGNHVLFARQGFGATGQVYRQRLYKFQINTKECCIMNDIYRLKDESWFEKAEKDPASVEHLDPVADAICLEGCGVSWKFLPEENRFHGATKEGTCRFESKFFPGKTIIASSDIYISSTELWTQDRGVDTEGNQMYGFKSDSHHKLARCDMFKGRAEYEGQCEEFSVHNQGGKAKLGNGVTVKLEQALEMKEDRKVLKLSLFCDGQEEPTAVALSDWSANEIGAKLDSTKIFLEKDT